MRTTTALAAGGLALAVVLAWRWRGTGDDEAAPDERWLVLTVDRPPEEVAAELSGLLTDEAVEVAIRPAPGDRGSELAVRAVGGTPSRDDLRAALREAKQLMEVGEVLRVDPRPAGRRAATPMGKAMDLATSLAGRKGVL
ncbi:hypothetical protein [Georgenia faecalis]|uniref:hypothetical protein n=1 Tax=Georgenia faecalis TaxID=2483799 RepID=UPI000FD9CF4D|nr:hypothetical protein [Georgenia faecalis]